MSIKWKSIRQIKLTDSEYKQVVNYLETEEIPTAMKKKNQNFLKKTIQANLQKKLLKPQWKTLTASGGRPALGAEGVVATISRVNSRFMTIPAARQTAIENKNPNSVYTFKRKWKIFGLNENKEIVLPIEKIGDVEWAHDKEGNLLIDNITLPIILKVVKKSEINDILLAVYSDVLLNAYSSVDKLHTKINRNFIGISRDNVKKFRASQPAKQINLPSNTKRIVKPIVSSKPFQQWEIDLVDF